MKYLIEIDTETKTSRIIETIDLTIDGICKTICSYFGLSIDILTKRPLIQRSEYAKCRKFISLFLFSLLGCKHDHIESILNYSDKHNGVISYNIHYLRSKLSEEEKLFKSKGILGEYTRTYENLSRLLIQSTIKK